eukprot:m.54783 g.54783  ORF g.54783 m.54783 type:complete len:57 (+) comp15527_c1_seq1:75-245(+)
MPPWFVSAGSTLMMSSLQLYSRHQCTSIAERPPPVFLQPYGWSISCCIHIFRTAQK